MIGTFRGFGTKALLVATLIFPQASWAEEFTGDQFLRWSEEAQTAFFQNSLLMASTISSRINPDHANCITDWFSDAKGERGERVQELLTTVRQYPTYHPTAVILAIIERECGDYQTLATELSLKSQ